MKDLWLPGPHITEGTRGGREPSGKNYSDRGGFMDKGARERKEKDLISAEEWTWFSVMPIVSQMI